jgi:two-component system, chemotaxis family, sensor kinase CheA
MINKEAFINQFLDELNEKIVAIDNSIIVLKKDSENEEELNNLLRHLHTIKGSSKLLKFPVIEKIAHGLENVFKGIKDQRLFITNDIVRLVFITSDYFRTICQKIRDSKDDDIEVDYLMEIFEKVFAGDPYDIEKIELKTDLDVKNPELDVGPQLEKTDREREKGSFSKFQSIRIQIDQIDEIVKSMNNLIIKQFQLKKPLEMVNDFEQELFEHIAQNRSDQSGSTDSRKRENLMFKNLQSLKKNLTEQMDIIELDTFELQENIIGLRMFPLDMILGSLPKMIEEIAMELGKEIDFKIIGSEVKLDKVILEIINDPIIHILRNSIDHGIEIPDEREKKGKNRIGTLRVNCSSEGGSILISIQDDGKGIDFEKVRGKAMLKFPMLEDEIRSMSDLELTSYLFMPGFSTSTTITGLSGRGVGLDIVKYNIEQVKGKINIENIEGGGTRFNLILPLSLATIDGYFIKSSNKKFFIPSNFIKEVIIVEESDKIKLFNKDACRVRENIIHLYNLSHVLGLEEKINVKKNFIMIVESFGDIVGIVVDSIIEYSSIIYKPLPPNLQNLKYVQGIVFDESYNIVNILFIPGIIEKLKNLSDIDLKKRYTKDERENKYILVVDDSLTTREISKSILESARYNVVSAIDGVDALDKIRNRDFNLIITDLQMPRMDGFTLIENIKREKEYRNIPVIVVSTLNDDESKSRVISMGVSSYIVKSEFDRNNLVSAVENNIL